MVTDLLVLECPSFPAVPFISSKFQLRLMAYFTPIDFKSFNLFTTCGMCRTYYTVKLTIRVGRPKQIFDINHSTTPQLTGFSLFRFFLLSSETENN